MRKITLIFLAIFFASCGSFRKINFQTDTYMSKGVKQRFEIIIPKNYTHASSNLETHLLKKWTYSNNECLYISLDISFADSPNVVNWMKCSDATKGVKCTEGKDEAGRYWKELLIDNLVVGYKDVPIERKEQFDSAISSLKRKN